VDIQFPHDAKLAAQAAKLGKPMAEVASGKAAAPFSQLCNMVLSHATEEGAGDAARNAAAAANQSKSLMNSLKGLVSKKPSQAAA
jgi:pilus assembly protein CpaE